MWYVYLYSEDYPSPSELILKDMGEKYITKQKPSAWS